MADYDCEWCNKEEDCIYAYDQLNCMVQEINENKIFTEDNKFTEFLQYLRDKNKDVDNSSVEQIISTMETMIAWSK